MPLRIEDYALIGDSETAALVGRDGSIDWLCWPRFDSDACFAALLGTPEHGRWLISPADAGRTANQRHYRGDTLILETRFETKNGAMRLVDFMPPRRSDAATNASHSTLVRLVIGERGRVAIRTELVVRFGYGSVVPWVHRQKDGTLRAIAGPDQLVLRTPVPIRGEGMKTVGEFTVAAGEATPFTLTYAPSNLPPPDPMDPLAALERTEVFWREWSDRARIDEDERRAAVIRSLITLKALTHAPTGGIVAAPTTSLPETLGGIRNWDYRFCWLRDATLSLLALMNAGYYEEAGSWRDWLLRAVAGTPTQAQIMYGVGGERRLTEWEVDWLPGYENAKPVRIGNRAHGQLQLDVYGKYARGVNNRDHWQERALTIIDERPQKVDTYEILLSDAEKVREALLEKHPETKEHLDKLFQFMEGYSYKPTNRIYLPKDVSDNSRGSRPRPQIGYPNSQSPASSNYSGLRKRPLRPAALS